MHETHERTDALFAGASGETLTRRPLIDSLDHAVRAGLPRDVLTFGRTVLHPNDTSWTAFRQRRYADSRGAMKAGTPSAPTRVVRVVEDREPSARQVWDTALLHRRAHQGEDVRVVHVDVLTELGIDCEGLPDLVLAHATRRSVLHTLTCTEDGTVTGGVRYRLDRDRGLWVRVLSLFNALHKGGEEIGAHLARRPVPWPDDAPGFVPPLSVARRLGTSGARSFGSDRCSAVRSSTAGISVLASNDDRVPTGLRTSAVVPKHLAEVEPISVAQDTPRLPRALAPATAPSATGDLA